ncbi:MAG: chain-length determining protein [Marinovum sp.]|nr:chain-length determining protein [Marinovum sp.]
MNQLGSIADIINVLRRRAPLVALLTVVGCLLSVHFALKQPKIYETNALVQLEDAQIVDQRTGRTDAAHKLQLIEQRMMARDNLIEIIEDYNLFADSDLSLGLKVTQLRESARITAITDASQPWAPNANPTGLIITVTMGDPQQAADVANELLARIVDQGTSRQALAAQETLAFFLAEEARYARDITALEQELATFKQINSASLPAAVAAQRTQISTFVEADLEIEQQILELQSNTRRARSNVEDEIALLTAQRTAIRDRVATAEAAIVNGPQVEQELSLLNRSLTRLQDEYSVVTRRLAEAETANTLQSRQQTERFEVLETALIPEYPVSRSRKKTAIMGGLASVILALGVALGLEFLNPAIRNSAQLERALGVQAVIAIPHVSTGGERRMRNVAKLAVIGSVLAAGPALWTIMRDRVEGLGLFKMGDRHNARL